MLSLIESYFLLFKNILISKKYFMNILLMQNVLYVLHSEIVYFVSSAERRILMQERVTTRSHVKILSARDTNDIFRLLYTEI